MTRPRKDFTQEELAFIAANYDKMKLREIARHLNREHSAIGYRVRAIKRGDPAALKVTDYAQLMRLRNVPFTPEEDNYILANQQARTFTQMGKALHRDRRAVEYRLKTLARRYGVGAPHVPVAAGSRCGVPWTAQEHEYLTANWGKVANETLVSVLGRSASAIKQRAYKLGLYKEDGLITTRNIAEIMQVGHDLVRQWIARGLLQAHRSTAIRKGNTRVWVIEPGDFDAFLKGHPEAYDFRMIDREIGMYWYQLGKDASGGKRKDRAAWSRPEVNFLIQNYSKMPLVEVAARLGRKPSSVHSKVRKLRDAGYAVHLRDYGRTNRGGKHWTASELEMLRSRYGTMPAAELARILARTVDSVKHKALDLGIRSEWKPQSGRFGSRQQMAMDMEYEKEVA